MNQYVDWQSLKRTKVEEIVPGDLAWWFIDRNAQLAVVLKLNHLTEYDFYYRTSLSVTLTTCPCSSLIKVVDNPNLLQVA